MGLMQEEIKHPKFNDVEIVVDQKEKGESRQPYDIINLTVSSFQIRTPNDLINLGEWLIKEGKRIKGKYTSTGKLKVSS